MKYGNWSPVAGRRAVLVGREKTANWFALLGFVATVLCASVLVFSGSSSSKKITPGTGTITYYSRQLPRFHLTEWLIFLTRHVEQLTMSPKLLSLKNITV